MTTGTAATGPRGGSANAARPRRRMMTITSWDEVPAFANEAEESAYWGTHDLGQALLDQMQPVPLDGGGELPPARPDNLPAPGTGAPAARTRPVSVRMDEDLL